MTSAAITVLMVALDVVENNAPINEAAGNLEQSALERESAVSYRQAIGLLEGAAQSD